MVNMHNKSGFSIAEALVAMLVLSTFFVVTSKVVNIKPKQEVAVNPHGFFECYDENGVTGEQYVLSGQVQQLPEDRRGHDCRFIPPNNIPYVIIYVVSEGQYYNTIQPQFTNEILLDKNNLSNFYQNFDEPATGNQNLNEFKNFLGQTYPQSNIYKAMDKSDGDVTYNGSAVFFGW